MTDYQSNLVKKKARHRGIYSGQPYQVAGRLFLASGTVLATTDNLLMVPVGENQMIKRVTLQVNGDTSTIAGSIGRFQILDADGNPVVVQRMGPNGESGTKYTSPANSTAKYLAAGQLDGYTETIIATVEKLAGPVYVGIDITTGGTIAADTEIFLGVEFDGETSTVETLGDQDPDNSYLLV
jgi:hypothetical protein